MIIIYPLQEYYVLLQELIHVCGVIHNDSSMLCLFALGNISFACSFYFLSDSTANLLICMLLSLLSYLVVTIMVLFSLRWNIENNKENDQPILTQNHIDSLMSSIPTESYVPFEDMHLCSIKTLRQIQQRRRKYPPEESESPSSMNSKDTIVRKLQRMRKSCESCTICFEELKSGDTVCILPNCHHEFHTDCMKKWSNVFVSVDTHQTLFLGRRISNQRRGYPSCPLCNVTIRPRKLIEKLRSFHVTDGEI